MQKKVILGVIGGLAVVLLIWAAAFARPYTLHGSEINPPVSAPTIQLTRADGSTFELSSQQGKAALIFFGYTNCPDFCPITMADFKRIKAGLGEAAERVEFILITVDPQRDTPEHTQEYVSGFDPAFIGLSGTEEELQPVWKAYGVYREIQADVSGHGSGHAYAVDHSTRTYLIDTGGHLRLTYTYGTPVGDVVDDLRYLLKESSR